MSIKISKNCIKTFSHIGMMITLLYVTATGWSQTGLRPVDYFNPLIGSVPMLE
jgi:hypothetical protein